MKIATATILYLLIALSAKAQTATDSVPAHVRLPDIPPFTMMKAPDSSKFGMEDLKKKRPVILVVFSPDCGHCKQFTHEMIAGYDEIKKAQIVMVSVLPFALVKEFYEKENIARFPSIFMGSDINNFLGTFFNVRNFPTVCVYNKKGKFVKRFEGHFTVQGILDAL